jgi:hypothetical protein
MTRPLRIGLYHPVSMSDAEDVPQVCLLRGIQDAHVAGGVAALSMPRFRLHADEVGVFVAGGTLPMRACERPSR